MDWIQRGRERGGAMEVRSSGERKKKEWEEEEHAGRVGLY